MSRTAYAGGAARWPPRLAWLLWALALVGMAGALWLDQLLRRAGRPDLAIRPDELIHVAAIVGMATSGVAHRRMAPDSRVGAA